MADVRRHWKYEKDIFGRRHRKYFLENVFGADAFDMKTFRALRVKMSRDYVGFFSALDRRYERGEFKQAARASRKIAREVVSTLDGMIDSGAIDKRDVDSIVEKINFLNEQRDLIVQKSEQVKALKSRLTSIEEETGIGPEALGVTERVVRRGAKREIQKRREGVLPFLKRTTPRTLGLGREIFGGLGAAALGPFAPVARMLGGVGGDILGLGRGLLQKVGERRERKLGGMLAPLSAAASTEEARGGLSGRGRTSTSHTEGAARREEGSSVLMDFFNRGAFRARWTKQLLRRMAADGAVGRGLIGGLMDKFLSLGIFIAPLVGTAGLLASLAVGIKTVLAILEYGKTQEARREAATRLGRATEQQLGVIKEMGIKEFAERADKRIFHVAMEKAAQERKGKEELWETRPPVFKIPGISQILRKKFERDVGIVPEYERASEIIEEMDRAKGKTGVGGRAGMVPPGAELNTQKALLDAINKLDEAALGLSKSADKFQRPGEIREPGIGNPWDSSDPWINGLASSELELDN